MPPERSSNHAQQPVQRRLRSEKACNFCRIAKQRCEPTEYGTNDRPCRRCVSHDLACNLSRAARSQSPSLGPSAQGPGPIHSITPHSAGGVTEELLLGTETNSQFVLQHSDSAQFPMRRCPPLVMHQEEQQGPSTTALLPPGQNPLQPTGFLPTALDPGNYQQCFVAQSSNKPQGSYYAQGYYPQATVGDPYLTSYASQRANDGAPNLGYTLEDPQTDDAGTSVDEQDEVFSHPGEF